MANSRIRKEAANATNSVVRQEIMTEADIAASFGIPVEAVSAIAATEFGPDCEAVSLDGECLYSFDRYYEFMIGFAKGYISLAEISGALEAREQRIAKARHGGKKWRRRRRRKRR